MEYIDKTPEIGDWVEANPSDGMPRNVIGRICTVGVGGARVQIPYIHGNGRLSSYYPLVQGWHTNYSEMRVIDKESLAKTLGSNADEYTFDMVCHYNLKFVDPKSDVEFDDGSFLTTEECQLVLNE